MGTMGRLVQVLNVTGRVLGTALSFEGGCQASCCASSVPGAETEHIQT